MKFCKKYQEYKQGQENKLPHVGFNKFKKILKRCRRVVYPPVEVVEDEAVDTGNAQAYSHLCTEGTFFPSLMEEMSAVVGCFNERAQKLLQLHLASGFQKYLMWLGCRHMNRQMNSKLGSRTKNGRHVHQLTIQRQAKGTKGKNSPHVAKPRGSNLLQL